MSHLDFDKLFDQLSIGYGSILNNFPNNQNFPPHNIIKLDDNNFRLELALAGFKKKDISIEEHNGIVTIKSIDKEDNQQTLTYQYHGIANRSFVKQFKIYEFFEIKNAEMEDGILTIYFTKNVPEYAKPKLIQIK